jgi:WD40 repeat protein
VDKAPGVWRVGEVVLDLYEVRDVISTGGMELVHRVLHRRWHVELAVKVRDVRSGRCLHVMPGHDDVVVDIAVTADGTTGVSVSFDGTTRIWDVRTGRCRHVCEKQGLAHAVEISSDGRFAVTGAVDGVVRIWDLDTGAFLHALHGHGNTVGGLGISEDGRIVTTSDNNGVTLVWELDWEYDFSGAAS